VKESFQNDMEFQKCRDESFQIFMNEKDKTPFAIAAYCNQLFIKLLKGLSDEIINIKLDSVVNLFQCLVARDLFLKKYGDFLAKRLLDKSTVSDDAEEKMISKLQIHCGPTPLIKITGMRKDMNISEDLFRQYKEKTKQLPLGVDLDVRVLSAGSWPSNMQPQKVQVPEIMSKTLGTFKTFYINKFGGKKINLLPTEGRCELEVLFAQRN